MDATKGPALALGVMLIALVIVTLAVSGWLSARKHGPTARELITLALPGELALLATVVAYICMK